MSSTTAGTIFTTFTTDLSTVLTTSLPLVVGILAGLVGLGIVVRYARRWIGSK